MQEINAIILRTACNVQTASVFWLNKEQCAIHWQLIPEVRRTKFQIPLQRILWEGEMAGDAKP